MVLGSDVEREHKRKRKHKLPGSPSGLGNLSASADLRKTEVALTRPSFNSRNGPATKKAEMKKRKAKNLIKLEQKAAPGKTFCVRLQL